MRYSFVILLFFFSINASGQTLAEWTQQEKTRITYLLNQLLANKAYISVLQKGYMIAKEGLGTIGHITQQEAVLHADYLGSLKLAKPALQHSGTSAGIFQMHSLMIHLANEYKTTGQKEQLNTGEKKYAEAMIKGILQNNNELLEVHHMLTQPGDIDMKDNERLQRINGVYGMMKENHAALHQLLTDIQMLHWQRLLEQQQIQHSRRLKDIP